MRKTQSRLRRTAGQAEECVKLSRGYAAQQAKQKNACGRGYAAAQAKQKSA